MSLLLGTAPNQVPTNGDLGSMAFEDVNAVNIGGGSITGTLLGTDATAYQLVANSYPSTPPSLMLDFANSKELDPRITFTRASTATYYDGVTNAVAEQNLLLQSQAFTTTWGINSVVVTLNSTVAPDGTTTGSTITPNTTAGTAHGIIQSAGVIGNQYAYSVYAKSNGYTNIQLYGDFSANFNATFDLTAGTAATTGGATVSIVNAGNGWYRCIAVFTMATSNRLNIQGFPTGATASNYGNTFTGDGTSGVFIWGAQLEQRSAVTAYTPTTTAAITNYIPVLQTAASGVARLDYNPTTGESLGLLIEESRVNLLTYSTAVGGTNWITTSRNGTITLTGDIAPDGTQTASWYQEDTTANQRAVFQGQAVATGTYTVSVYAKSYGVGVNRYLSVYPQTAGNAYAIFDVRNGVVLATGAAQYVSSSITSVGNGWYRCTVVLTTTAGTLNNNFYITNSTTSPAVSYTGDGWSGIYIWGAQAEAGAFATSYIPTVASQVTRAADAASMTGTNFSSWFNVSEFTFVANTQMQTGGGIVLGNLSSNSFELLRNNTFSAGVYGNLAGTALPTTLYSTTGSTSYPSGQYVSNTRQVFAYALKNNSQTLGYSGSVSTNTATVTPGIAAFGGLYLNGSGIQTYTGTIKRIMYYPQALTSAQLQALTT